MLELISSPSALFVFGLFLSSYAPPFLIRVLLSYLPLSLSLSFSLSLSLSLSLSFLSYLPCCLPTSSQAGSFYVVESWLNVFSVIVMGPRAHHSSGRNWLIWLWRDAKPLNLLTYADVCWRMLTYADVCWRMLTSHAHIRKKMAHLAMERRKTFEIPPDLW